MCTVSGLTHMFWNIIDTDKSVLNFKSCCLHIKATRPWSNVMKLMKEYDAADTELLIYAMSLINKTLYGLPDQDMYYDQVDAIEEQGIESIIRR